MESIVQQKTFQKKLESAEKDKKGRPLGKDLDELTNIVFEKLKEGEHLISQPRQTAGVNLIFRAYSSQFQTCNWPYQTIKKY